MVVVGSYTGQGWMVNAGAAMALGAVTERKPKNERRLVSHSAMIRSAIQPQEVLYGRPSKKGGVVTWFGTSGGRQEYLWYVITVCEHEIDGFEKLWIDDVEIDIATEITANEVTKDDFVDSDGNRLVKAWFYTGTDGQTANADLVSAFTEWTTDHRGRGVAYFVVRLEIDTSSGGNDPDDPGANVWSKGAPRELAVTVRGKKVYDPRLDSTNGGSGTHRLADPTTWEWSQNPALCRADYLMSSRFGPGLASSEIDWSLVATAADLCDEQVAIDAESPATEQDRYQVNGVASVDQTPKSILESIHTADHGTTVISAEGARIYSGGWNASVHNVDESWLAGAASVQSAVAADATYNAVRGRYLQPDGQSVEFAPKTASAYESEDGGFRVWRDIDLPWTTDNYMAQRLGIIELKKSRQQTVVNLLCNYRAELVQVWDIASLTIDEAGFDAATFRVIGKTTSQDGTVTLQLRQEAESDWSFTIPDLAEPPVVPSVTRNPAGIPAPSALASTTVGDGIRLEWDNPNMGSVSHIEVWAATTNDRSTATLVTRTASESFVQALAEDTVRYYWILARGYNNLVSAWHPTGSTDGIYGIAGGSGQGAPGDPGAPALDGFANVDGPAAWVRDQDGSTWNPTATTADIDWTFAIAGTAVARISRRVTRSAAGLLTVSTTTHPAGDLNTGRVTISTTGGGTRAVTLVATYDHDGYQKAIAQGVVASLSGTDGDDGAPGDPGDDGLSVAELLIFRRASSAPTTPTGGSYNFGTKLLTPPTDWFVLPPSTGTDPVYRSRGTASVQGTTGVDSAITWSAPDLDPGKYTPITIDDFAAGVEPVVIHGGAEPASSHLGGEIVFWLTNGKLYRWNGSAYTVAVPAVDITGTLTSDQIASIVASKVTGQLTSDQIASLVASKITGQLQDAQLAAIGAAKITGQLTDAQIAALAAAKITGTITETQIADDAITTPKLAAGAVTASEIAANTITAGQIASQTITAAEIAGATITGNKIAGNTITAAQIASETITANEIASNAVTTNKINAGAVNADKMAANSITAANAALADAVVVNAKIGNGEISTAKIGDLQVTGAKIANATIGNAKISDLSADKLTAGTINAALTMTGSLVVSTNGAARSGQTAYNTGTGWWLGTVSGTPKFSIGNGSDKYLAWTGSGIAVKGDVQLDNGVLHPNAFRIRSSTTAGNSCPPTISDFGLDAHASGTQASSARSVTLTGFIAPDNGSGYSFKRFAFHKMDVILESEVVTHSINNYTLTWQYSTNNGSTWSTIATHTYNGNNTRATQNTKLRFTTPASWSTLRFRLSIPSNCSYMQLSATVNNWAESGHTAGSSSSLTSYVPPPDPPLPPGFEEP